MKRFTRFAAVFLTAAILFGLAGCKKDAETKPEPEAVYYTVSFDTDGAGDIASQKVEEGKVATKPEDPAKTGYSFGGWYNGETAFDFATAITTDVTLKAKWTLLTFTVTFDTDGGSEAPATQTIGYGSKVTKPENPTKDDFSSLDWMNGNVIYDFDTPVTSNLSLKAKWYIGSKAPYAEKDVGDIVFNDGSATPYVYNLALSDDQKSKAIALIFYKGTGLNSDDSEGNADTTTSRTLGVGLKHTIGIAWCTTSANAYKKNLAIIQCPSSGSGDALIFTGDKNGSDNLEQIAGFLSAEGSGTTDDTATKDNYPAFYFGKNYKEQKIGTETESRIISGSEFETGWYLPSIAELFQIYANGKGTNRVFYIDAASELLGGDKFESEYFYSSSPMESDSDHEIVWEVQFSGGPLIGNYTSQYFSTNHICAIREF